MTTHRHAVSPIECYCGMVHRIAVNESALCQCGAVISLRQDSAGWIMPWIVCGFGKPPLWMDERGFVHDSDLYSPRQSE